MKHKEKWEKKGKKEDLFCVSEIGSNYIEFHRNYVRNPEDHQYNPESQEEYFRLHFDSFDDNCRREDNWNNYFINRNKVTQEEIRNKTRLLIETGKGRRSK